MSAGPGRSLLPALLAACVLIGGGTIQAGSFGILPVQIFLSPKSPNTVVSLHNQDQEALRLQFSAYVWEQDASGGIQLTPTGDVVFYPRLLSIPPGEKRNVRVGVAAGTFAEKERTYRLLVQELGPVARREERRIRMLTRLSLPVFLQPSTPQVNAQIENVAIARQRLRLSVRNIGNVHVQALAVRVTREAGGESLVETKTLASYVLAGGTREFELALPEGRCAEVDGAVVEVQTRQGSLQQRVALPTAACGD